MVLGEIAKLGRSADHPNFAKRSKKRAEEFCKPPHFFWRVRALGIIPYQAPNPSRPGTMAVKQHKGRRSSTVVASESAPSSATQSNCSTEAGPKCNRLRYKAPPNEMSNPRDHRGHDYHRRSNQLWIGRRLSCPMRQPDGNTLRKMVLRRGGR